MAALACLAGLGDRFLAASDPDEIGTIEALAVKAAERRKLEGRELSRQIAEDVRRVIDGK